MIVNGVSSSDFFFHGRTTPERTPVANNEKYSVEVWFEPVN